MRTVKENVNLHEFWVWFLKFCKQLYVSIRSSLIFSLPYFLFFFLSLFLMYAHICKYNSLIAIHFYCGGYENIIKKTKRKRKQKEIALSIWCVKSSSPRKIFAVPAAITVLASVFLFKRRSNDTNRYSAIFRNRRYYIKYADPLTSVTCRVTDWFLFMYSSHEGWDEL